MKLLILTADYPRPDGSRQRMYVHTRNLYYKAQGLDVTVLNFACPYDYRIDGIRVISLAAYQRQEETYDIAVSHASNLRNHYRFLKKYSERFPSIVFFFHGHEVLHLRRDYPEPYPFLKEHSFRSTVLQDAYDEWKLALWSRFYRQLAHKAYFVFVSHWIKQRFHQNTGLSDQDLCDHSCVIPNSVGAPFEMAAYCWEGDKPYDFITIRADLDGAKYGVDLVVQLAERNPDCSFLLIGKGRFFACRPKPQNIDWIDATMSHQEMLCCLDQARCGLLPTRQDTQGVMTCEFAAYGIPVVTSDLEVCHEFFDGVPHVAMVPNDRWLQDAAKKGKALWHGGPYPKDTRYFSNRTIAQEIELFSRIERSTGCQIQNGPCYAGGPV